MGVLNTQDRVKRDELLSTVVGDQDAGETSTVEEQIDLGHHRRRPRHSQTCLKPSRAPRPQTYIKNTGRKAKGCANSRKFENAAFLSHLIETEEFSDLNITDFMVKSASAFEKLFEDQSQMNRWSAFINLGGEDQDRYLSELSEADALDANPSTGTDSDLQIAAKKFQSIDNKIKSTLRGRNVSMSTLKYFEEEMLSFFKDMNEVVLISLIPSSLDRLLIHGICQYMNLTSQSDPKQVIQVENLRNQFHPPVVLLSQYLERCIK